MTARYFFLCLLTLSTLSAQAQWSAYTDFKSFAYSESVAIKPFLKDWNAPLKRGSTALTYNQFEIGMKNDIWRLALLSRYDYWLSYHPDTAEFYHAEKNKRVLDAATHYNVNVDAKFFFGRGIKLAYLFKPRSYLHAEVGLTYLLGQRFLDGSIQGNINTINNKDYDYNATVDYRYSEDVLFKRRVDEPAGRGYSIDLNLDLELTSRSKLNIDVRDLISAIFWSNAPYTEASVTSDTKTFDEDGFVRFAPSASGLEGNRDFRQQLPRRILFTATHQNTDKITSIVLFNHTKIKKFLSFGLAYRTSAMQTWSGIWNATAKALTLSTSSKNWQIAITSNSIELQKARTLGIETRLYWRF